jgi:hypothetical protein
LSQRHGDSIRFYCAKSTVRMPYLRFGIL